jgi:hypothetical protein
MSNLILPIELPAVDDVSVLPSIIDISGFPVTIATSWPTSNYPPKANGYVESIKASIGPADTISFFNSDYSISYGRIIDISFDLQFVINDSCSMHPYIIPET